MRRSIRAALVLTLLTATSTACSGAPTLGGGTPALHVSEARASSPVAGASQLVVTIENRGDGADRLIGAETDSALAVEIHRTIVEDDGRAFMRGLDDVLIGAGETVRFRPGGLHLMVVVPDERVRIGGTFEVTLLFERSAPVILDVEVVAVADLLDVVERDALGTG